MGLILMTIMQKVTTQNIKVGSTKHGEKIIVFALWTHNHQYVGINDV